ncbi:lipopolysaccharide biosynthesis protein [Alkalilimnicola ehrlichii]|uniref:Lipopolysaccharide biosynthesis protein n=1 Tax=Alkalilimnicola ehrlichii TaxID=351052 RepID=A0A3E0WV56_9GAMM|nr:Wzz/FepE/Etk N-terminal domain-containing protein [Alkalilimnicola ehrlichii]RFA29350.1 lipopolysaccharide biosynthesis protein [Alkalilimnicola ehrlichii]RFA36864.1 lipopolysaccharide biosynthesis protein [Alkalilimnicola ehrlichii]
MATQYTFTVHDYMMILKRRFWVMLAVAVAIMSVAVAAAVLAPPIYRSTGTILVESQQIPPDLVPTTVTTYADERIQLIQQRVMTRDNLLRIVDQYGLFEDARRPMTTSNKLREMRSRIRVELIRGDHGSRRGTSTLAFNVSFDDQSPQIAYRVANDLVTLFLSENVRVRTERATDTTRFLAREAEKLRLELEELENQVALYKQRYSNALPEHLDLRMTMLQRTEAELRSVEREYGSTQQELRFLDVELSAARAGLVSAGADGSIANDLPTLRAEYERLISRYTADHPDVRAVRSRIRTLETDNGAGDESLAAVSPERLQVAKLETRIEAANARIASLADQRKSLQNRMEELERQILETPQVERALFSLMRDHENARRKYEEVRAKQVDAQMAESLEEDSKAERFAILEPPILPDNPVKPDRMKILLLGFFLAGGGAGGVVFLLELLNRRIRGAAALGRLARQAPLVVVPYIKTSAELARRRWQLRIAFAGGLIVLIAVPALLHILYMPLDMIFVRLIARFG